MEGLPSNNTGIPRSRKLRKGTFSCLECKRRKRRCEFQPQSPECSSCRRRGLPCVSQERGPEIAQQQIAERVSYVEDLVTLLLQKRRHQGLRSPDRATASELGSAVALPRSPCGTSISIVTFLRSVFPSPHESASILSDSKSSRMPYKFLWPKAASLTQEAGHPPPEAHPIWYGRKFMELALCLQDAKDPNGNASRYVEIVSRHISSTDGHMQSAEGVETLMLEAMYYVNDDKPKAAWLKCRRALSIAQLLLRAHPGQGLDQILLRLVYGDRIISLELGLPYFGVSEPISMNNKNPGSRLEYIHLMLATRIIERNMRIERGQSLPVYDEEAREMDSLMKSALNCMPQGWWSVQPSLLNIDEDNVMAETAKLSTQLNHYWFLFHIHQPFIINQLRSEISTNNSYSGTIIATACRQVLLRFIAIRNYHDGDVYRGTDSKAISAAIMLVLTHIEAHRHHDDNDIQHLHPQDIDLVRQMLDLVDTLYGSEARGLTIKRLLEIEADAASGGRYMVVEESEHGIPLSIPYMGSLRLVKDFSQHQIPQRILPKNFASPHPSLPHAQFQAGLLLDMDSILDG